MLTAFLEFAATAGPRITALAVIGIFAVPCVIAWLISRKLPADKDISVSLFGQVFKMDVKSSSAVPVEHATEKPTLTALEQRRPARRRRRSGGQGHA